MEGLERQERIEVRLLQAKTRTHSIDRAGFETSAEGISPPGRYVMFKSPDGKEPVAHLVIGHTRADGVRKPLAAIVIAAGDAQRLGKAMSAQKIAKLQVTALRAMQERERVAKRLRGLRLGLGLSWLVALCTAIWALSITLAA